MSEKILDFLTQAANGNALEAEQTFKELISQKVQDRLEDIRADVMSEEEVELSEEELDELSKKTLGSYVNKSTKDIANKEFNVNTNNYTTSVPNINKINEIIRDHTIIGSNDTKFNKSSYVDKNIISD